jgi:SHS2 domain-containing protein
MDKFKFLEHTADIKFQAFGKTKEEAFKNSAFAMFYSMNSGPIKEKSKT